MSRNNGTRHETAFTVSIEARDGVTTGISAADRARTVAVAIDASQGPRRDRHARATSSRWSRATAACWCAPGIPRRRSTSSRLAGLNPSGVICEIMNEDGTMARLDDLVAFAQLHNLKIGTIRDLIAYRRRHDHLVEKRAEATFTSRWGGDWRAITFHNKATGDETIALVKGRIDPGQADAGADARAVDLFVDMFGEASERSGLLSRSMEMIAEEGAGVIVVINRPMQDGQPLHQARAAGARRGERVPTWRNCAIMASARRSWPSWASRRWCC